MGMEMDRLDIVIEAQAKSVSKEIDALYNNLGKIASALNRTSAGYRSAAREAGRMVSAFRSLASVRIPDFGGLVSQLQTLSQIKLDNLQKKVEVGVDVNIPKSAGQIRYAIEKAIDGAKVDSSKIADQIIDEYKLKGRASQAIRKLVDEMTAALGSGLSTNGFTKEALDAALGSMEKIEAVIREHGFISAETVESDLVKTETAFDEFAEYMRGKSIYLSSELSEAMARYGREFPGMFTNSLQGISNQVIHLDTVWDEWTHDVDEFGRTGPFSGIFQREMTDMTEQLDSVVEALRRARRTSQDVKISGLSGHSEDLANEAINETAYLGVMTKLSETLKSGLANAIEESSKQLTLNIDVNQEKIVRDIQSAINKASKATFTPVKVTLDVEKGGIANKVQTELRNIDVGNLTELSNAYSNLINEYSKFNNVASNAKGINQMVSTIRQLATSDLSGFDADKFTAMTQAIGSLASMQDVSTTVNKLVNALTRLARAGNDIEAAANALPALGAALRAVFDEIGQSSVSSSVETVLSAFTRLATSGEKANVAAQNLPALTSAIRDFIDSMAQAPAISDTTLRMTEAFTNLATNGKRIAGIGGQVGKSLNQVSSASNKADSSIGRLNKSTSTVINAFRKLLSACGNAVHGIGSGAAKIVSHFKSIGNGSKHINQARISLKNLLQVALGFYGIRSLFSWGKQAVELASNLTEVQNVVENSFGTKGTANVEDFAKSANTAFGITELTAKKTASRFQAMGNAMGITSGQVASATQNVADKINESYNKTGDTMGDMAVNLTKLTADMASFYNVDQERVAEAMNAVYTGQTRPLRQYGLDLTQATLQEWANKQGIEGKIAAMSQAEKTMLRYQYVMANTSTVQGDFARTSETWANQVRILKQNLQALGSVIGGTLINVFRPLVVWLNKAMSSVISFAETIGNALGKIFGWKILHTPASNAADVYDTLSDSLGDTGSAGNDAADGLGKATKAANEYKNTVLGFDELNKLNDVTKSSTGSGGSGGGSGSGSGDVGTVDGTGADFQLVKAESWYEAYKSDIDNLYDLGSYISGVLRDTLSKIKWEEEVFPAARNFGTGLAQFLNGLLKPETFNVVGTTAAQVINTALHALDSFGSTFDWKNFGKSLASGLRSFLMTLDWGLAAKNFTTFTNGILDAMNAALDTLTEGNGFYIVGWKIRYAVKRALGGIEWDKAYSAADKFGTGLAEFLNGLIDEETFAMLGETVGKSLNTGLRFLNSFGKDFKWDNFGRSMGASIKRFFNTFDWDLLAQNFETFTSGILTAIKEAIGTVSWTSVGLKIRRALLNINWDNLLHSVGSAIMTAINAALDLAKGLFDGTPVEEAVTSLKTSINEIVSKIDFPTIKKGFDDLVKALAPAVSGFAQGLIDVMDTMGKWGADFFNSVGKTFGAIADALNSLPPGTLKEISESIGEIVGWLLVLRFADKAVTVISNFGAKLLGLGGSGVVAAAGIGSADSAAATAAGTSGGITALVRTLGTTEGGLIGALVIAGKKFSELHDVLRGGNGIISTESQLFDELTFALRDAGIDTGELSDKLFGLINQLENGEISTTDFKKAVTKAFEEAGVSADNVDEAINGLVGSLKLTDNEAEILRGYLSDLGDSSEKAGKKVEQSGKDTSNALGAIWQALRDTAEESDQYQAAYDKVLQKLEETDWGEDASAAFNMVRTALQNGGLDVEAFERRVDENLSPSMDKITTKSDNASKSVDGLYKNIEGMENMGTEGFSGAGHAFDDLSDRAENATQKTSGTSGALDALNGLSILTPLKMALIAAAIGSLGEKGKLSETQITDLKELMNNYDPSKPEESFGKIGKALDDAQISSTDFYKAMKDGAKQANIDLPPELTKISTKADTLAKDLGKAGKDGGNDYKDGLVNSIRGALPDISSAFGDSVKAGMNTVTDTDHLNAHSPSLWAEGQGKNVVQGLINGLNALKQDLLSTMSALVSDLMREITDEQASFKSAGTSLVSSLKSGLTSIKLSDVAANWRSVLNMSSLSNTLYNAGRNAAQSLRNGMKSVSMPRLSYYISSWNPHSLTNGQTGYTPVYSPQWYKMGGFPNVGEMFIANESGPEMVGKMGRKNVVANNMQITAGIKEAVVEGMMEVAMSGALSQGGNDGTPIIVESKLNVDGETLARTVEKGMAKRAQRFNPVGYSY